MATHLKDGQTLLFIGDSITDCGRRDPQHAPLGCGYVKIFSDFLCIREPEKKVTVINRGIGGNTVDNLRSRWNEDVLWHRPDWLSIKIGINDLNQNLTGSDGGKLSPEHFQAIYDQLLALTRGALPGTQLLIISPFFLSRDTVKGSYRSRVLEHLSTYASIIKSLSETYGARYIAMHDIFQRQFDYHHPDVYCPEPVHPNQTGHTLIAESVYEALSV